MRGYFIESLSEYTVISSWTMATSHDEKVFQHPYLIKVATKSAQLTLELLASKDLDVVAVILELDGVSRRLDLTWKTCGYRTTFESTGD